MLNSNASITEWLNAAGRKPALPRHTFNEIAKRIQSLDVDDPVRTRLINKLVEHNLKLVAMFVHRFMSSKGAKPWGSEETLDYLQVGALGLRRAVEKYDPTRGYCFSTYAQHWIRSFVGRYNYREMSIINIPENSARAAFSFLKHGKPVGSCAFAAHSAKELTTKVMMATRVDSLDRLVGDELTLIDFIKDELMAPASLMLEDFPVDIQMMINKASLSQRDIDILRFRYIDGWSVKQIAEYLQMNANSVSKTLAATCKKLKDSSKLDKVAV